MAASSSGGSAAPSPALASAPASAGSAPAKAKVDADDVKYDVAHEGRVRIGPVGHPSDRQKLVHLVTLETVLLPPGE